MRQGGAPCERIFTGIRSCGLEIVTLLHQLVQINILILSMTDVSFPDVRDPKPRNADLPFVKPPRISRPRSQIRSTFQG